MRDQSIGDPAILLEQPHFLVVNKPAGLFTQAAQGIDSLQNRLVELLAHRDRHAGTPFIGLPHRLDRETSGAILIARNQRALKRFGEQFHSRKISKFYLTAVHGVVSPSTSSWHDHVRKVADHPMAEICARDASGAKPAHLDMRCLSCNESGSLLLIQLHTGRMHQIRIQAASRGYPILGDQLYCSTTPVDAQNREKMLHFMALHSLRIEFRHPQTAKLTAATAPLPETWTSLDKCLLAAAQQCIQASIRQIDSPWSLENAISE